VSGDKFSFSVDDDQSSRLDKFLAERLPEQSRSRLQALIKQGLVLVNQIPITKTGYQLSSGDDVAIEIPAAVPIDLIGEDIPLDIIFENSDLLVINKPAGMVVHPSPGHSSGTLVHAALGRVGDLEGIGGELRPGVVHRLDKDTSGLIIMAKNELAHRWLQDQFRLRKVEKIYIALVDGAPPTPKGRVEAAIARDPSHRKKMAIVPDAKGREAVTEYRTLETYQGYTLIEAHPLTGRTHQIRLHLAFLGCPIAGDLVYGKKRVSLELKRHFLHAAKITIQLPGEKELRTFSAPLPDDLQGVLQDLKNQG
jgi:23S rRNA pseudouridine1911/1915/1917 synthase